MEISQHMFHSHPLHLSRLNHELAQRTHYEANAWHGIHQVHQGSNKLYVHLGIHQIRIISDLNQLLQIHHHGCGHGLIVHHTKSLEYLNYMLPL